LSAANTNKNVDLIEPKSSQIIIGRGIKADIDGASVLVGNDRLLLESSVIIPTKAGRYIASQQQLGRTVILVANNGKFIGAIAVADTVRPDSVEVVAKLRAAGKRVVMLTGDNTL